MGSWLISFIFQDTEVDESNLVNLEAYVSSYICFIIYRLVCGSIYGFGLSLHNSENVETENKEGQASANTVARFILISKNDVSLPIDYHFPCFSVD